MFYIWGWIWGSGSDHSAIAVVERDRGSVVRVRHLERIPLGMPYPGLWSGCGRLRGTGNWRGIARWRWMRPEWARRWWNMLRAARLGCDIAAVTITGGDRQHRNGSMRVSVPKRDLMAVVQVLLENDELKVARGLRELGALLRELTDVRSSAGIGGRVRLGADGCGEHDDLVIALALACWRAKRGQIGFGAGRLPGI